MERDYLEIIKPPVISGWSTEDRHRLLGLRFIDADIKPFLCVEKDTWSRVQDGYYVISTDVAQKWIMTKSWREDPPVLNLLSKLSQSTILLIDKDICISVRL